jgi:hypothetical protein
MDEFAITVAEEGTFLRITLAGPASRTNLLAALQRLITEVTSRNVWRVLVDANGLPSPLGTFEKYEFALEVARVSDPRMKTAVVARPEMVDHFFETVARNRGVGVMVFSKEAPALEWLLDASSR